MVSYSEIARDSIFAAVLHLAPRFANVIMFIIIGRLSGPTEAGAFALATTYLLIFSTLPRGVDDLTIREVSRQPEKSPAFLSGFLFLRLLLSVVFYWLLSTVVTHYFDYSEHTVQIILILTLSLIPESLAYVVQSVMLGHRQFALPAIIFTAVALIKLIGGGWIALSRGELINVAWVWVIASLFGFVSLFTIAIWHFRRSSWKEWFQWRLVYNFLPVVVPFFVITSLTTLETQGDTIVLSYYHGEDHVGWYNAATTIAFSLGLISQAIRYSIYPVMTRYEKDSSPNLTRLYHQSLRFLGTISMPMVVGIALLAPQIVQLIYGEKFEMTIQALRFLIPVVLFMFLNVPITRMMLVKDRQGWISIFLIASALTNFLLNIWLDPGMGASGAALARLTSSFIYFIVIFIFVNRNFVHSNPFDLFLRPAFATLIMAVCVWPLRNAPLAIPIAVGIILFFITLWVIGGIPREMIDKLSQAINIWHKPDKTRV